MKEERITTEISIDPIQRRQIQLIQLEMLIELDRICKEHHIVYRLIGGTLIGAVRHKGFIPWDPDLDVSMDRKDYNRFFEICKTELDTERFFCKNGEQTLIIDGIMLGCLEKILNLLELGMKE